MVCNPKQKPQISQEYMNPNFKKFQESGNFLKLKHWNHVNSMHTQKTIDHLNSKHSKLSKSPKILRKFMIYA